MKPLISDAALRDEVMEELEGDPEVDATHISVTAVDAAITLGGQVETYHEKHAAVRAAERVAAVRAVADDIVVAGATTVSAPTLDELSDDQIAEEIATRRARPDDNHDSVGVQVRDGRVILHGQVDTASERDVIDSEARQLTGIRAVADLIEVKPDPTPDPSDIERRLREAIASVDLGAGSVQVELRDGIVHLDGSVGSVAALNAVIETAKTVPGVAGLESDIAVRLQ